MILLLHRTCIKSTITRQKCPCVCICLAAGLLTAFPALIVFCARSYVFQPDNAIPVGTFIDDFEDQELLEVLDMLLAVENVDDVRTHITLLLNKKYAVVAK